MTGDSHLFSQNTQASALVRAAANLPAPSVYPSSLGIQVGYRTTAEDPGILGLLQYRHGNNLSAVVGIDHSSLDTTAVFQVQYRWKPGSRSRPSSREASAKIREWAIDALRQLPQDRPERVQARARLILARVQNRLHYARADEPSIRKQAVAIVRDSGLLSRFEGTPWASLTPEDFLFAPRD